MTEWQLTNSVIDGGAYGEYTTLQKRQAGNDWYYEIILMTFGKARIIFTDGQFIEDGW